MKLFKQLIIISLITIFFIEIFSYIAIKAGVISRGLPSWVTLYANEDFGYWHPKNITFKKIKIPCWESTITYNNLGMRGFEDVNFIKTKKRIGLLGDSLIENIELSDGKDVGSLIKKKLPNYEILNFSARGTGLADQTDIYRKLIKKFNIDYLFLFISDNDFINNSVHGKAEIYLRRYDYIDNKIIEVPKDYEWLKNYNSPFKYFKRNYLVKFKNLNSYYLYIHVVNLIKNKNHIKKNNISNNKKKNYYKDYFDKNKKIYSHIQKNFLSVIDPNLKLFVVLNLQPYTFVNNSDLNEEDLFIKENVISYYESIWSNYNPIHPIKEAEIFINKNDLTYPYLFWKCGDKHYNKDGSQFISSLIKKIINDYLH